MKIVIGGPQQINSSQMRLREIFSVERILNARGFQIKSEGGASQTVLEKEYWTSHDRESFFEVFQNVQMRSDLLRATLEPNYVSQFELVRSLTDRPEFLKDRQRFSTTFEWFVGELLARKFGAFSSSFGVTVGDVIRGSDGGVSGDYDVLSVLGDMNLLYLECKTGKCHRSSILNSIERSIALHSIACVILLEGGISKTLLLQQLHGQCHPRFGMVPRLGRIATRGVPESDIYEWSGCFFISGGTSGNIEIRLRTVMRILAAYRSSVFEEIRPRPEEYGLLGYEYSENAL